ncbi:DUF1361 domain-containing protein [Chamaesiphon minutus]|uniref:Putative membrane protein n=1 Tax=Chamaesiphon minutus (strain ATCC 27169 / PCC 6605) TaxID=1173020 RepID=K9ULT7_CHAP6|nr:DUF1361 domain-containing protein [Chamaesiphon minutus]AFY96077.1 putative membrane protein [Chamaesiphon minutus PCC 6605]
MTLNYQILSQLSSWKDPLIPVIADDIGRIAWNTFLALVPLTLSFFLFYKPRSRVFCWSTYILLGLSFVVGIKKYNDGNLLVALERIVFSLWGVRLVFIAIALGAISILLILDRRLRDPRERKQSIFWWIGLFLFVVILPNAPYILTDIIHFYDAVREIASAWMITLVIVPIYIIFIGTGWFSYVFSLVNLDVYFSKNHWERYVNITELSLHVLCAIGIYIGRFLRFNSWSLVTQPKHFLSILPGELIGKFPLVVILLTIAIIAGLYALCKPLVAKSSLYRE